ncbi:cell division protein FtsQ/DivIB [Liquorilactobacillus satsumensis]|uniref:Cell division protein DivIB n=2 Tax=Liquorilactobacillus satsumensis TaxID=259059 RepID=A0A0R1V2X8_9LACO|nr:cell division protein [Liquorilactobacillus satsumensis DSM 16230 = JCM 12392]MCP9328400.1 cell division protein FtsQ/DivIB [Liquorilactobacillus satsumensis]
MMRHNRFLKRKNIKDQPLTPWEEMQRKRRQKKSKKRYFFKRKKRIGDKLPLLTRQRNQVLRRRLSINLVFFSLMGILSLYFILPISRISQVTVTGADAQTRSAILAASGLKKGGLLLKTVLMQKKIKQEILTAVAEVKQVRFNYDWTTVKLQTTASPVSGYVLDGKQYYALTKKGVQSQIARNQPADNYPVYSGFGKKPQLKLLAIQMNKMPAKLTSAISEVHYDPSQVNSGRIRVYLNDGNEVIATISTFATKMAYYPAIKAKATQKILVDFEVGAFSYPLKSNN